jgi:O-antigen biosynthesis protein
MFTLSIVIPTCRGRRHLERCLPSVCRHAPAGTQILVVDDESGDGTADWIRTDFPTVDVLALETNRGFCGAVNAGIAAATGDIVELLNDDTEVEAGWADAALRRFDDPAVGSVAPLVLAMDRPDIVDSAGQAYHVCGWATNRGYGQSLNPSHLQSTEILGPSGSSGFYRRTALERAGSLLPEYGAYLEDVDLSFRLRWAGYRSIYEPASRVRHRGHSSYGQDNDRVVRMLARNEEFVYWMNLPTRDLLRSMPAHFGFLVVRLARKTLQGRLRPYLAGKMDAIASVGLIRQRRRQLHELAGDRTPTLPMQGGVGVLGHGLRWMMRRHAA